VVDEKTIRGNGDARWLYGVTGTLAFRLAAELRSATPSIPEPTKSST